MITRVKGSVLSTADNVGYVSTFDMGPQNTDITAALLAALTAGSPVSVGVGTWLFTTLAVPDGSIIIGAGEKSVLKQKDLTNAPAISVGSNCLLYDFMLDGNKVNQVGLNFHGFTFNNSVDSQGVQLYAQSVKGSSFRITGAATSEVHLLDCSSTGHTESGILVDSGANISLVNSRILTSDAIATGDGISIASNGLAISNVTIQAPIVRNQTGRGIALIGNGSKNVTSVAVTNPRVANCVNSGIHLVNADGCAVIGGMSNNNGIDGVRIEGDVQNCRIAQVNARNNTQFGQREVVAGSTPNLNTFIYGITSGNGTNAITKVGASSVVL
jgi:hypothetical protein